MFDFLGVSVLLGVLVLSVWLAHRARRIRRRALKWLGVAGAGIAVLLTTVILGAVVFGYWKLNRNHDNPVPEVTIAVTPERVARGARFEPYCGGCHSPDPGMPMTGQDFLGEDAPPIGTFHAPNLTPVQLEKWSDGEIIRAIREGIHRNGRSLLIMPSRVLRHLSDDDVQAIVAYLRSLSPEGSETPRNRLNVLGAAMASIAPIFEAQPPVTEPIKAPPPGPTAAYGAYLSSFTCAFCHGEGLRGDPNFAAPGLTFVPQVYSTQAFIDFMRTGIRPNGSRVDGEKMPWEDMSRFLTEDDELRAIYAHIERLATQ